MSIDRSDEGRVDRSKEVVALCWAEGGVGSFRWWETAPASAAVRRAVVIWLWELGRVAWWISEGEATLGIGYVESLDQPSEAVVDEAKRAAELRWLELAS